MKRQPVSSSDLCSVGYDSKSQTLEIEFYSGGIYQYFGVPCELYEELMNAPSLGSFFHRYIKNNFSWTKV
jgi:hypothetical protein